MTPSLRKSLCRLMLPAVLLAMALPATASQRTTQVKSFELDLEREMNADQASIHLPKARESAPLPVLDAAGLGQAAALPAAAHAPDPLLLQSEADNAGGKEGGFGRWLKRNWWIPVLVGAAVGVAVSGGDGDDNEDDPED